MLLPLCDWLSLVDEMWLGGSFGPEVFRQMLRQRMNEHRVTLVTNHSCLQHNPKEAILLTKKKEDKAAKTVKEFTFY